MERERQQTTIKTREMWAKTILQARANIRILFEGSDTAEISYTRLRNKLKSNPKSRNHERN